jgi:hypothetical protein
VFHIMKSENRGECGGTPVGGSVFLIRVLETRHATWQGTVTLPGNGAVCGAKLPRAGPTNTAPETLSDNAETRSFRSLLELIYLIDDALGERE